MPPTPAQVAQALAELLGSALAQGATVRVPELGTFRRHHEPGRLVEQHGRPVMAPPADLIAFDATRR